MRDEDKTKEQLKNELIELRRQVAYIKDAERMQLTLATVLDNLPDGIVVTGLDGRITYVNKSVEKFTGYSRSELLGEYPGILNADEKADLIQQEIADYIHNSQIWHGELLQKRKDGLTYIAEFDVFPVEADEGTIIAWASIQRDITHRKQAEEGLLRQFNQISTIFDSLSAFIYVADIQNHELLFINKYGKNILGEKYLGKRCYQVLQSGQNEPCNFCTNDLLISDGLPGAPYSWEFQNTVTKGWYRCIDKAITWVDGRLARLEIAVDITDRKLIEEQLLRITKAVESTRDAIGITDATGKSIYHNRAFCELFEYSVEELNNAGGPPALYCDPEVSGELFDAIRNGDSWSGEVEIRTFSGRKVTVLVRADAIKDNNNKIVGLIGIHSDITEHKKDEEALRLSEERFSKAFNASPCMMTIANLSDNKIIAANDSFLNTLGYALDEVIGQTSIVLNHWVEPEIHLRIPKIIYDQGFVRNLECCIRNRSGEKRVVLVSADIFKLNGEECLLIAANDITPRKQVEEALEVERRRLYSLLDSLPAIVYLQSQDYSIRFANRCFWDCFGKPKERPCFEVLHGRKEPCIECQTFRVFGTKIPQGWEWIRSDGRTYHIYNYPFSDIDGAPLVLVLGIDITESKKAEEALINALTKSQQREAEIKALLESTRSVLKYQVFTEAAKEIFYTCMNLVGAASGYIMLIDDTNHCYDVPFIELGGQTCSTSLSLPIPIHGIHAQAYHTGKAVYHNTFENSKWQKFIPEGHIRIDNALYAPFQIDDRVVGLLGLGNKPGGFTENDVRTVSVFCELVAVALHNSWTLESLKFSEERFSKAFNASPCIMVITRIADNKIIDVNECFLRTLGYSREEIIGHSSSELNIWGSPEDRAKITDMLQVQEPVRNVEVSFYTKTGELRVSLLSAEVIDLNGELCWLFAENDITERKAMEQQIYRLDRLNLVGEMAAGIGHEIRNPMTTVRGFLQILGSKQECAKFKEYYDLMIEELDRANNIITEYLSLAKNKAVELRKHNLNTITRALSPLIQADAIREDKQVIAELEDIPDLLLDEKEIRQLILNLVRNGLEAMSPHGILTIKTFTDDCEVILAVQDQGNGIEPHVMEKVGTPFFTTKDYGTGLGLAVCFSIAARHNATIKIDTSSSGTTFLVRFNLQQ